VTRNKYSCRCLLKEAVECESFISVGNWFHAPAANTQLNQGCIFFDWPDLVWPSLASRFACSRRKRTARLGPTRSGQSKRTQPKKMHYIHVMRVISSEYFGHSCSAGWLFVTDAVWKDTSLPATQKCSERGFFVRSDVLLFPVSQKSSVQQDRCWSRGFCAVRYKFYRFANQRIVDLDKRLKLSTCIVIHTWAADCTEVTFHSTTYERRFKNAKMCFNSSKSQNILGMIHTSSVFSSWQFNKAFVSGPNDTLYISCNCNWGTCIVPPTNRSRAHHRVNLYPGARRQNETQMLSDHEETSPSIAAVSALSAAWNKN